MNNIKIVCRAFILDEKGSLVLTRKKGSSFWSLPGGKLEQNDKNLVNCLTREIREELDLSVEIKEIIHAQDLRKDNSVYVEMIWKTEPISKLKVNSENILDISAGELEDVGLFSKKEVLDLDFKPEFIKNYFINS